MKNQVAKKWYDNTSTVIVFLIFFFPVGLYLMWKNDLWSKTARIIVSVFFGLLVLAKLSFDPEKRLPQGVLTGNDWFVEKGNPNNVYKENITLKFTLDNKVEAWEGGEYKYRACSCDGGSYLINDKKNQVEISGLSNSNCLWMSKLNGAYLYKYDGSRKGYNKYMLVKNDIVITHFFEENK